MKKIVIVGIASLALFLAGTASAQVQTDSRSNSEAAAQAATNGVVQNDLGVQVGNAFTFNGGEQLKRTEVKTVGSAILGSFSSSFSSDYCGGTVQAGGGFMGWAFAGGGQKFDKFCQRMRFVERGGQIYASLHDRGYHGQANSVMSVVIHAWCTSLPDEQDACQQLKLIGTPPQR